MEIEKSDVNQVCDFSDLIESIESMPIEELTEFLKSYGVKFESDYRNLEGGASNEN